jgi:hypothetical protein
MYNNKIPSESQIQIYVFFWLGLARHKECSKRFDSTILQVMNYNIQMFPLFIFEDICRGSDWEQADINTVGRASDSWSSLVPG